MECDLVSKNVHKREIFLPKTPKRLVVGCQNLKRDKKAIKAIYAVVFACSKLMFKKLSEKEVNWKAHTTE